MDFGPCYTGGFRYVATGVADDVPSRFNMRSSFRYPAATIALMVLIFAGVIMAIHKAETIRASYAAANPHVPPVVPLPYSLPQNLALMFVIAYAAGMIGWAVLHALRKSGAQRLADAQTWPQGK